MDNITDIIKKIPISLGTGVFLFKSLYFQGVSNIFNFLNNNNHIQKVIIEIIIDNIKTYMQSIFRVYKIIHQIVLNPFYKFSCLLKYMHILFE